MSTDLAALVGESYERAYTDMVRVQQLTELVVVTHYMRGGVGGWGGLGGGAGVVMLVVVVWL